jgi:AraC family transcriptional regulator
MTFIKHTPSRVALTPERSLITKVEHRQAVDLDTAQLNIFETHQKASEVKLCFSDLVVTTMLRGKKVMHLPDRAAFDYLPGESVIVQGNEEMKIDFPEADDANPTQCLALVIDNQRIKSVLERLNSLYPKVCSSDMWSVDPRYFHLSNSAGLSNVISQIVDVSLHEQSIEKEQIVQLKVEELLIRLMQTQARKFLELDVRTSMNNPFAYVTSHIRKHLDDKLEIHELCKMACMSKASFYRQFVREFGITPAMFIQKERLRRARWLLEHTQLKVSEIAFSVGFNNVAHFVTAFKKEMGAKPSTFQRVD